MEKFQAKHGPNTRPVPFKNIRHPLMKLSQMIAYDLRRYRGTGNSPLDDRMLELYRNKYKLIEFILPPVESVKTELSSKVNQVDFVNGDGSEGIQEEAGAPQAVEDAAVTRKSRSGRKVIAKYEDYGDDDDDVVGGEDFRGLKVADLKIELEKRGLAVSGRKAELQERLNDYFSEKESSTSNPSQVSSEHKCVCSQVHNHTQTTGSTVTIARPGIMC